MIAGTWAGHTDTSRDMAHSLADAIDAHYPKRSEAAAAMRISAEQLSRQLSGADPLNLWRIGFLPIEVRFSFYRRELERLGGAVLTEQERAFILGFVGAGAKRMAKVAARFAAERKVS